jgi:hypothetical protein
MKLRLANEEKLFDVRLRDRLIAEGKLSKDDHQKFIEKLPDDSKNAVYLKEDESEEVQN